MRLTAQQELTLKDIRSYRAAYDNARRDLEIELRASLSERLRGMEHELSRRTNDAIARGVPKNMLREATRRSSWSAFQELLALTAVDLAPPEVAADATLLHEGEPFVLRYKGKSGHSEIGGSDLIELFGRPVEPHVEIGLYRVRRTREEGNVWGIYPVPAARSAWEQGGVADEEEWWTSFFDSILPETGEDRRREIREAIRVAIVQQYDRGY